MDLDRLQALETIEPRPLAPWRTPAFTEIDIEPDREKAKDKTSARRAMAGISVFPDASGQNNQLGAAAVALDRVLVSVRGRAHGDILRHRAGLPDLSEAPVRLRYRFGAGNDPQ